MNPSGERGTSDIRGFVQQSQSKGKKGQAGFVPSVLRLAQENNLV